MDSTADFIMPSHITTVDHARIYNLLADLDSKIIELGRKIEKHRQYSADEGGHSNKCHMICKQLQGETKLRCLKQCVRPVVSFEKIEDMSNEFPIDVQRLRDDIHLRERFERHQYSPDSIEDSEAEASAISDIYAMPIATVALPDESWNRAIMIISKKQYRPQREHLIINWKDRQSVYTPEAQEELSRKIERHDQDNVIMETIRKVK